MEWIDPWKTEPPRNEDILFLVGDGEIHLGCIFNENEKLRKCEFHSYLRREGYSCDSKENKEDRVLYWFPIPKLPDNL
jgi:hypothetical protein